MQLVRYFFVFWIMCHWFACTWIAVGVANDGSGDVLAGSRGPRGCLGTGGCEGRVACATPVSVRWVVQLFVDFYDQESDQKGIPFSCLTYPK